MPAAAATTASSLAAHPACLCAALGQPASLASRAVALAPPRPHASTPRRWSPTPRQSPRRPSAKRNRIARVRSVYWTEMNEWYHGDMTSSHLETGDDGQPQRATRVLYDAIGPWTKRLAYSALPRRRDVATRVSCALSAHAARCEKGEARACLT